LQLFVAGASSETTQDTGGRAGLRGIIDLAKTLFNLAVKETRYQVSEHTFRFQESYSFFPPTFCVISEERSTNRGLHLHDMVNTAVKGYLVVYNLVSFFGWALILSTLFKHIFVGSQIASAPIKFSEKFLLALRPLQATFNPSHAAKYSPLLAKYLDRGATLHTFAGGLVALVQSGAVLEVVHAAIGFVKSPVPTTAIQVASRLWLVWGISERFSAAASSPLYASMIFAWSLTECVRYPFYANALMGSENELLLWAR
jgi:hypothetical protein